MDDQAIAQLAAQIHREKVERARQMSIDEKFRAGLELFDFSCRVMMDGIRMQHPDADEAEVRRLLSERFAIARRLEDAA